MGPVVGGLILSVASWRWIFFVNVPIGLAALVLAARLLPRAPRETAGRGHLDPVGVLLLGGGVLTAMLPLVQLSPVLAEPGVPYSMSPIWRWKSNSSKYR